MFFERYIWKRMIWQAPLILSMMDWMWREKMPYRLLVFSQLKHREKWWEFGSWPATWFCVNYRNPMHLEGQSSCYVSTIIAIHGSALKFDSGTCPMRTSFPSLVATLGKVFPGQNLHKIENLEVQFPFPQANPRCIIRSRSQNQILRIFNGIVIPSVDLIDHFDIRLWIKSIMSRSTSGHGMGSFILYQSCTLVIQWIVFILGLDGFGLPIPIFSAGVVPKGTREIYCRLWSNDRVR